MASKAGQHRDHAKVPHPIQDLVLQQQLLQDPRLRQRAAPALDVAHSGPEIGNVYVSVSVWAGVYVHVHNYVCMYMQSICRHICQ